ncbi:hypothetical protein MUBE_01610 [Mycobacterium uberis]|uniref:TM2 domain-containing protein n=1 Tax=Mycobacterium uberis TaxID=2162698 RepID=A0A3E1HLC4_9MYCO|nr:NINE protein [Mycobacterium uberis]RFD27310.1 hypothetical protein MUBE_01610 [Mycobacterium uberis]
MTDQLWSDPTGSGFTPPPGYPSGYSPSYPHYPGSVSYLDPAAPWGRHPVTGQPLSDKSKTVAGLLQLFDAIGIVGISRIYLGGTGLGIAQLLVVLCTCGLGTVVWGVVDALLILTEKVSDPSGRPLFDGT